MNQKPLTLIERSTVAKRAGGPEAIRKLPLTEKLFINAQIAKELGRPNAYIKVKAMRKELKESIATGTVSKSSKSTSLLDQTVLKIIDGEIGALTYGLEGGLTKGDIVAGIMEHIRDSIRVSFDSAVRTDDMYKKDHLAELMQNVTWCLGYSPHKSTAVWRSLVIEAIGKSLPCGGTETTPQNTIAWARKQAHDFKISDKTLSAAIEFGIKWHMIAAYANVISGDRKFMNELIGIGTLAGMTPGKLTALELATKNKWEAKCAKKKD